jgi:putative hemolysin
MKRRIIDIGELEKISPIFRGEKREWLSKFAMRIFDMDKVNDLYERSCEFKGAEFADHILDDLGVEYLIGNVEQLKNLPEGAFVTISNHPYGGLDGVMLIDLMAHLRPDYKLMVNQLLSYVEAMEENFISVKPKVGRKNPDPKSGINSIRETLSQLKEGHSVGFFPAGAVSMYFLSDLKIRDRKWQDGVLKIIQKAGVPVLPIRFFDRNSRFFYFLGFINWRIRTVRMPYELFNKFKRPQRIGIGDIIPSETLAEIKDIRKLNCYLRKSVYDMSKPKEWYPRKIYKSKPGI